MRVFERCETGFRAFLSVCVWLSVGPSSLSGQDPRALELMEEAGARYRGVESFCAVFEQELANPLLGETTISAGNLCQKRPNFFSMRFTDPAGDALVADGEHFWVSIRASIQFKFSSSPWRIVPEGWTSTANFWTSRRKSMS